MLDDFEDASICFQGLYCTSQGRTLSSDLVQRVLDILVESKLSLSKNHYVDLIGAKGFRNAAEIFRHKLDEKLKLDNELLHNRDQVYRVFDWFLRYETIENSSESMQDVSISSYTDWTDSGDGTLLNFKHGYRSLLNWFCSQIPTAKWVRLNKQVVNIEMLTAVYNQSKWKTEHGRTLDRPILIKYMDTSRSTKAPELALIECDHVIVTVSLGFLKRNQTSLFTPPLPESKRELIKSLGFGTVNKIVLQFDRPYWNKSHGIKLIWTDQDAAEYPAWVRDIIAFDPVRRQPDLLIGWIGGEGARLIESERDEDVARVCLKILDKFTIEHKAEIRGKLVSCICSRWHTNSYICGSYSYHSMSSFEKSVDKLQEPLYDHAADDTNRLRLKSSSRLPRVLFAGEATAGKLYSTTHGAIMSGWREADRIRDHLSIAQMSNSQPYTRSTKSALGC